MTDKDFLKLAFDKAGKSYDGIGAIIVKDGKLISTGHNLTREENDPTSHAEVVAIRKACRKLGSKHIEGCALYSNAEPCFMCLTAASWAHIDKVVYGKKRGSLPKVKYHTLDFNIHDLNSRFNKPLEIVEIKNL